MNNDERLQNIIDGFNALPGVSIYQSEVVDEEEDDLSFWLRFSISEQTDGSWGSLEVIGNAAAVFDDETHIECFWTDEDGCLGYEFYCTNYETAADILKIAWRDRIIAWEEEQVNHESEWLPISQRVCTKSLEDALWLLDTFGRKWMNSLYEFYVQGGEGELSLIEQLPLARIFVWEMENGRRLPKGYWLKHECGTRQCVNPDHAVLTEIGQ